MLKNIPFLFLILLAFSCNNTKPTTENSTPLSKNQYQLDTFPIDASIRAIAALDENTLWFGGSKGTFGYTKDAGQSWIIDSLQHPKQKNLEFRGIAKNNDALFLLAIASPALLFKSTNNGKNWKVVYEENHPGAFYDAIAFWDSENGIAMGDPTDGCLSIILTLDGGETWTKVPCENLPPAAEGEAAYAASNSNIALIGNQAWVVSGGKKARVFHSPDKGKTWEVFDTPIIQGGKMTGIFSVAFYDENNGIIFGGDWEKQEQNTQNKAITKDGGKTWTLIADGQHPGYRSSVQYIPNTQGKSITATGIPGISHSEDGGQNWMLLDSATYFYTTQFAPNTKVLWMAGRNKVGRLAW